MARRSPFGAQSRLETGPSISECLTKERIGFGVDSNLKGSGVFFSVWLDVGEISVMLWYLTPGSPLHPEAANMTGVNKIEVLVRKDVIKNRLI